jgi:hypothetical protein
MFGLILAAAGGATTVWVGYRIRSAAVVAGGTALTGIGGAVAL